MKPYLAALVALLIFAACAAPSVTSAPTLPSVRLARPRATTQFLYVASANGGVSVYRLGSTVPLRTLPANVPAALAFDQQGNLYVANQKGGPKGRGFISVFPPNTTAPARTISNGVNDPLSLAFDVKDNLYVANVAGSLSPRPGGSITVYKATNRAPYLTITHGTDHPRQILFAGNGDLIAAVRGRVRFYGPGATEPMRTIRAFNSALGLEGRNRIFAGNSQSCPNYCFANFDVFVPWKNKEIAYYNVNDLEWNGFVPTAFGFDSTGNIYVALSGGRQYLPGRVAVFPPLPNNPAYEQYSFHGPEMTGPLALVVDASDNIIVGNNGAVDAYRPNTQTPSYAITQGISGQVTALAIASR